MHKKFLKPLTKDKVARSELQRAHFLVVLLSLGLVLIISINMTGSFVLPKALSLVTIILLIIVIIISLGIILAIQKLK